MKAFQSLTEAWEESSPRNKTTTERADSRNGHIALAVIVKRHVRQSFNTKFPASFIRPDTWKNR